MATWTLGSTTLPEPKQMRRRTIEGETMHQAINGRSTRDISNRKEQIILMFTKLSQADVASILSEYNLMQTLDFTVTDGDLTIEQTEVHVHIPERQYNSKGSEFREDIEVTLTEVE